MKTETLPNGLTIPKIGYGMWKIGGGMSPDTSQDAQALKAIRTALDVGYTHFDTAEMYARGHSEELLARALKEAGVDRDQVLITTKVTPSNLDYDALLRSCEASLRRLETDYVDLYLIHWPGRTPLEESMRALNQLVRDGRVRHVGVSNFQIDLLAQAIELCETGIVTNQVPYSISDRSNVSNGMLDYCRTHDILLTAYSPVSEGRLKIDQDLQEIAEKHGASPYQVALAWLVHQPRVITIPMSMNPDHIAENFQAADLELDAEDMARLEG